MKTFFRPLLYALCAVLVCSIPDADAAKKKGKKKTRKSKTEQAAQPAPASSKSKSGTTADYSSGFGKFYKFGLPNVKDAEYVKLNFTGFFFPSHNHIRYQAKVEGNAWKLSEDKNAGTAQMVIQQAAETTVYDQKKLTKELTKKLKEEQKKNKKNGKQQNPLIMMRRLSGQKLAGTWQKANLEKDADRIIKHLKSQLDKDHFFGRDSLGEWFLFAVHLYSKGLKEKANELAGTLFELGKGKRMVILQALNALADGKYYAVYAEFKADGDWKKFSKKVDAVYKLYQKGWKKAPGVKMLAELLHSKVQNKPLAIKGLSKDEEALVKELLSAEIDTIPGNIWVLSVPESAKKEEKENQTDEDSGEKEEDPTVIEKITERGMGSVPFLIKLLGNKTLIKADKDVSSGSFFGSFSTIFSGSSKENTAYNIFSKLKRPMTLGELARKFLDPIVIKEEELDDDGDVVVRETGEDDTDEFSQRCKGWYKQVKNQTSVELAETYLNSGSKKQKLQAVSYLLNNKIKSAYPLLEKFLLESKRDKYNNTFRDQLAVKYAGRRGPEAKPFAEKYIDILDPDGSVRKAAEEAKNKKKGSKDTNKGKKEKAETKKDGVEKDSLFIKSEDEEKVNKWKQTQIMNMIEKLRAMTSDETIEEVLDDILGSVKGGDKKKLGLLFERLKMSDKTTDRKIAILLKGALSAAEKKDAQLAYTLLNLAYKCTKNTAQQFNVFTIFSKRNNQFPEKIEPPTPTANKKLWLKLLKSSLICGAYTEDDPVTLGVLTAVFNDMLFGGSEFNALNILHMTLGDKLNRLLKERMIKRLDGVAEDKLPKIPNTDMPDEERKKAVKAVTAKVAKAANPQKALDALSLKDTLLLKQGLDENPALNKKLLPYANKITEIKSAVPAGKKFSKYQGKQFSAAMMNELREFAVKELKEGKRIYCRIDRQPCCQGIKVFIGTIPKGEGIVFDKEGEILLSAFISIFGAFNTKAYWPLEEKQQKEKVASSTEEEDPFADLEEAINEESENYYKKKQDSFNQSVKELEQGNLNSMLSGGIYLQGGKE